MRRKAAYYGAGVTTGLFVANEFSRLVLRSPFFKLTALNSVLLLVGPTLLAKQAFNKKIDERIANMWRVHKNRVDKGLGGTWDPAGYHESMKQDFTMVMTNASIHVDTLTDGVIFDHHIDNPFIRWHKSFEEYSSFLGDMDDFSMHEHDELERFKKFKPDPKKTIGTTTLIPREDNDEKFEFWDMQGESVFSNPPNPNFITVDHGLDEDSIWAFPKTMYNQDRVKNTYTNPATRAFHMSFAPMWGQKL